MPGSFDTNPNAPIILISTITGAVGLIHITASGRMDNKLPGNLGWAMLPECSDYAEWKFGKRGDGLLSSSYISSCTLSL